MKHPNLAPENPETKGRLPDFVVIGASKSGTTSLHFYLSLHPQIYMPRIKEPNFFDSNSNGNWSRGIGWYRSLFVTDRAVCGEASTGYTHWPVIPRAAELMHDIIPDARLIYCLRPPYERLVSHYLMSIRRGTFAGPFREFLESPYSESARAGSNYGTQLKQFLRFYPREQILLVESAELKEHRAATLAMIFQFLGADPGFQTPLFRHERYIGSHQPFPSATGRRIMNSRFMKAAERVVLAQVFYHLRNLLLWPFSMPQPSLDLAGGVEARLRQELKAEVELARELSGLPLPSLQV